MSWRCGLQVRRDSHGASDCIHRPLPGGIAVLTELYRMLSQGEFHRGRRAADELPVNVNVTSGWSRGNLDLSGTGLNRALVCFHQAVVPGLLQFVGHQVGADNNYLRATCLQFADVTFREFVTERYPFRQFAFDVLKLFSMNTKR